MSLSRRDLILSGAGLGVAALARPRQAAAQEPGHDHGHHPPPPQPAAPERPLSSPRPTPAGWFDAGKVVTPAGGRLPWRRVGGVKIFHLVAEPIVHEMTPGLTTECWGYNGRTPGPTIEVTAGDRCRFYVTNRLPEATTIHWHGVFLPNGMDGVGGLTQKSIPPGETYVYDITFGRPGTFMYHPHFDEMTQIALGMQGMIVVHPADRKKARPAGADRVRDYAIMLNEWKIVPGARRPDPLAMNDFNLLTMNSKVFPSVPPLVAELGDLVRIRFGNLSAMDHHPIHVHGHAFSVVETDGGQIPASARVPETTVLVPVGSVRVVEFIADAAGDWPLHCHMTHHVMNQMGHDVPNFLGADTSDADRRIQKLVPGYMSMGQAGMGGMAEHGMPAPPNSIPMRGAPGPFGYIDMGGMFTIVKIRERLDGDGDPGWFKHPDGTVAQPATSDALARDGVTLD